jgi:hypothetical protein
MNDNLKACRNLAKYQWYPLSCQIIIRNPARLDFDRNFEVRAVDTNKVLLPIIDVKKL